MPEPRDAFRDLETRIGAQMHTGDKHSMLGDKGPFCICMDCARQRDLRWQREYKDTLSRLSAEPGDLDPVILRDANAQKVVRQLTYEIEEILTEYDEMDTITGSKIVKLLREHWRVS